MVTNRYRLLWSLSLESFGKVPWETADVPGGNMMPLDPVTFRQLPVIQKIIDDETWLEGERRGCRVSEDDPVVRENVCLVVLRIGKQLRESMERAVASGCGSRSEAA
jgi:hypothetical protein